MDKENVVHLHIRIQLSGKKTKTKTKQTNKQKTNGILTCACKWMELENIILSEATQTQKDEYGMYSLINGY